MVDGWNLITRGVTQRFSIMTLDNISTILNDGIQTIIITSLPSVGVGLIVRLIIALFQAVTQIQEQTLTFVPKMVAVFLIVAATFPWMAGTIIEMTTSPLDTNTSVFTMIITQDQIVIFFLIFARIIAVFLLTPGFSGKEIFFKW